MMIDTLPITLFALVPILRLFHRNPSPPSLVPLAAPSTWVNPVVGINAILMLVIALIACSVVRVLPAPWAVPTARLCVRANAVVVLRVARVLAPIRQAFSAVRWAV
jgi:hypothetical protein